MYYNELLKLSIINQSMKRGYWSPLKLFTINKLKIDFLNNYFLGTEAMIHENMSNLFSDEGISLDLCWSISVYFIYGSMLVYLCILYLCIHVDLPLYTLSMDLCWSISVYFTYGFMLAYFCILYL